jgi:phosphodiesterase/alkaline phosphatase D-like protein
VAACVSRGSFKFVLSSVSRHGSWGDRWAGYPHERDELLDVIRAEPVTVLGVDIHAAVDVDLASGRVRPAG